MKTKRSICLAVVVATFALLAGACGSDGDSGAKKSDKSTTSTTEAKKDGGESETEATTTTVSDEDFTAQIEQVNSAISEAGTEPCKLMNALSSAPPTPANSDQSKKLAETYSTLLRAVANALPESSAANVKALNDAAGTVKSIAESQKFAPELFQSTEFGSVMSSQEVTSALSEFTGMTTGCSPTTEETPEG